MTDEGRKLSFELCCRRFASGELQGDGIGTYSEKRLHKVLKHYFCPDETCHEVRIRPDGSAVMERKGDSKAESGRGGFIADIFKDEKIIEIQTGSFYPLKKKIEFYLSKTDYEITVVHPLAAVKWISWISTEDGSVSGRKRSPKKCAAFEVLPELFWLSEWLGNPRLHFKIMLLEIDEFRILNGWSADKKKGAERYERVPTALLDEVDFCAPDFAKALIPQGIGDNFTASHFSKITKLKGRKLSYTLKLLCQCGAIDRGEKAGRSYTYKMKI